MKNLYGLLEKATNQYPDRTALIFQGQAISYVTLKDATDRLAEGLKNNGFGVGDRIALMLPNIPHFPMAYYAILKIGAVVVPVFTDCMNEEIHHQLEEAEVKGILFWEGYRNNVTQFVRGLERCQKRMVLGDKALAGEIRLNYLMETNDPSSDVHPSTSEDTAIIVYTDRMKGRSKGVELTHQNLLSNVDACTRFLNLTSEDGTVGVIPFYHMLGQTLVMNLFLSAGGRICLVPKFQPETVSKTILENRLTYFIGVPYMIDAMVHSPAVESQDFASLRTCLCSGDALTQDVLDAFESKCKVPVLEGYGLSEASPMVTFNSAKGERKAGSIGMPLYGIEIKLVNENDAEILPGKIGEIVVHGPNIMKGYLNRPEATKEALRGGWLHTGDLAFLDDRGQVSVVTRKRNVIIKSGFSIYPNDIESILKKHPKVTESVVVGLPDHVQGEEIHACIVLKSGETLTREEIIEFLKESIPIYQCPQSFFFVTALPKGPTGRVIRDQVKHLLLEKENLKK